MNQTKESKCKDIKERGDMEVKENIEDNDDECFKKKVFKTILIW